MITYLQLTASIVCGTKEFFPCSKSNGGIYGRLAKRLRKELSIYVESAILFGDSVMKREANDTTVDLCLIINSRVTEQEIRGRLDIIKPIAWKRYGAKLQTIIFTEPDFIRRAKRGQVSIQTIIKEGQVISGKTFRELLGTP